MQPEFHKIMIASLKISKNIILFLPRNIDISQLQCLLMGISDLLNNSGEIVVTVISLLYSKKNIKSVLVLLGPLFEVDGYIGRYRAYVYQ